MHETIVEQAFSRLYPAKQFDFSVSLKYSGRFKGYNANAQLSGKKLVFSLAKQWRLIDKEIKIGLIQGMMARLFKTKNSETINTEIYNNFMKGVSSSVPKTKTHPVLALSFERVNEGYFYSLIDKPNLAVSNSTTKLGSYDFGTDTLSISRQLLNYSELLDYVMYHELLHKKLKFSSKKGKTRHHTAEFRFREKKFRNSAEMERKLEKLVQGKSL